MVKKDKMVVVVGPTATGKSDLAVRLARKFNGDVVSADSRQVYRGLDIGSGKITTAEMRGVPHHMLDVASPTRSYSAARYKKQAEKVIQQIIKKERLPIVCGGSGFYINALIDGLDFPAVPPNTKLREKLNKRPTEELAEMLGMLDPRRAADVDKSNKHRLIRALEIASALGSVPHSHVESRTPHREVLMIGLDMPDTELKDKIAKRLTTRLKTGMVAEVRCLHEQGLSWKRLDALGLEYRYMAQYLQSNLTENELIDTLNIKIWQYAKRQRTWFRRDKRIKWFRPNAYLEIEKLVRNFIQ